MNEKLLAYVVAFCLHVHTCKAVLLFFWQVCYVLHFFDKLQMYTLAPYEKYKIYSNM